MKKPLPRAAGLFLLYFAFTACGGSQPGTGALSFSLAWRGGPQAANSMRAPIDCAATGVATVQALVYDGTGGQIAEGGPWSCDAHSGTISGIPAGINRTLVVIAKDGQGGIVFQGEKTGVTVTLGQTSSAGEIIMNSAAPVISQVTAGFRQITLAWSAAGATSYNLYWSTSPGVSKSVHEGLTTGITATTHTYAGLTNGTTYYYVVTAIDAYGESRESAQTSAAPKNIWMKTYGGAQDDTVFSLQSTTDGGYILAGDTMSFGTATIQAWVVKLDSDGAPVWQKTYGGAAETASSVRQTGDGGYIVAVQSSPVVNTTDFSLLRLKSDGALSWQKNYGIANQDLIESIRETSDNGYIVAGYTLNALTSWDAWLLKLDSSGAVSWQNTFTGVSARNDLAKSVMQTADGGYVVGGRTLSYGSDHAAFVMKLDSSGSITAPGSWLKIYGHTIGADGANAVRQTADGGYVFAGYQTEYLSDGVTTAKYLWISKLTSTGADEWSWNFGGPGESQALSVEQTADLGYIVAGVTSAFGAGDYDAWVLKFDAGGNVQWQKTYGGAGEDRAFSVVQSGDGGYAVAGSTRSFGAGGSDGWVLKLDSQGSTGCAGFERVSTAVAVDPALVYWDSYSFIEASPAYSGGNQTPAILDSQAAGLQQCHY